jgi:hypothetical protein
MKQVPADDPGHDSAASRFAGEPAGRVRAVVYRPVVPYLLRLGLRVLVSGREAERVRMLAGAGLSRAWSHDRAHFFFARARWNADDLGLAVARLVVALLVPPGEPVTVDRRHPLQKTREEGVGRLLVPPRFRARTCEDGVRQQMGDRRGRGAAAGGPPRHHRRQI